MEIYYTSINAILFSKCIHAGTLFFFNYTGVVYVRLLYAAEVFITQPGEAAVYFHYSIKDLNEIRMLLLIPHFSMHAGRCSSVPVRVITGSMITQN